MLVANEIDEWMDGSSTVQRPPEKKKPPIQYSRKLFLSAKYFNDEEIVSLSNHLLPLPLSKKRPHTRKPLK